MKIFLFVLVTVFYLIVLTLYNYSLYKLLTSKNFGHQYYLILIYFLCELFSFFDYFISKKREIIIGDINPYIVTTELSYSLSISDISNNNISKIGNSSSISNIRNNSDNSSLSMTSNNLSSNGSIDSNISKIPFIGIKCISFILSSFLDFLSKIFIYNGIKYMYQDSILRSIIELLLVCLGSLFLLKIKNYYYAIIGLSIIVLYLLIFIISHKANGNGTGTLLLLEGGLLDSIQYLIQSKFFYKGEHYIYRIVSWEGLYGSAFSLLILIIASIVSCPFEKSDEDNNFDFYYLCNGNKLENNFLSFISGIKNNYGWFIAYIISCIFYSYLGVFITRYINVIYRVSLDAFRMLFFIITLIILNT